MVVPQPTPGRPTPHRSQPGTAPCRIVYVSFGRLTDKFARDWYIDYLIERGVSVEYWDIVALVREEHSERGALQTPYLRVCRSYAEVERMLCQPQNRGALYIMLISYVGRFARIFRLLSKYNCRMATFAWGALPRDPVYRWRKIAAWCSNPMLYAKELVQRIKASALRKLKLVKPFDVAFVAGETLLRADNHASKVVPVNYFDYDHYVRTTGAEASRLCAEPYGVFLDINLPYHTDLALCGYRKIDPGCYYRSLNRFFGVLEGQKAVRIVIAAHPRADYDDQLFDGRPIYRLMTAELVRDAEFVLSHTSTAMSYAVLNAKPLLFIYTDDMVAAYKSKLLRDLRCYADYLDAPSCNIDSVNAAVEVPIGPVNRARYEHYKYDFLTSHQSETMPTQEIVWREIVTEGC
jgi:hypothetical protein